MYVADRLRFPFKYALPTSNFAMQWSSLATNESMQLMRSTAGTCPSTYQ